MSGLRPGTAVDLYHTGEVRKAAEVGACLIVAEFIVTPPGVPGFAKGFDTHMMVWGSGKERTEAQVLVQQDPIYPVVFLRFLVLLPVCN